MLRLEVQTDLLPSHCHRSRYGFIISNAFAAELTAQYNSDEKISGGGFSIDGGIGLILASEPQNNSWVARAANPIDTSGGNMGNLTAHAACIKLVLSEMTK